MNEEKNCLKYFRACHAADGADIDALKAKIEGAQDRLIAVSSEYNATHKPIDDACIQCYKCGQNKLQEAADKLFLSLV